MQRLAQDLTAAIAAMGLKAGEFGKVELVEHQARECERTFQGNAIAKPSGQDSYAAALAFLRGQELDAWQRDLVASALAQPIREYSGAMVLGSKRLPELLRTYGTEARRGDLWRLTWHGLLYSYFHFDPDLAADDETRSGWLSLRALLAETWPLIDERVGEPAPDWVVVLRSESDVLTPKPVEKYARAYLAGQTEAVDRLAADLGIPPSSWFWHALVLGAVKAAAASSDVEFRRLVPQLLQLIQGKPGFRDKALEVILVRYHGCHAAPVDERLRDFVCQPTVWKNPKLKAAGIATAWNRVPDPVGQMVLGWVNERNLKDFFDILAARNNADEGRLAFWSKYLNQITWTRLVFGSDTMALKRTNAGIRDLIAREEGAYAQLTSKPEVDAFMMQIGSYLIIEFSKKPNACYVYRADELPFEPYDKHYQGNTADLAAGFRPEIGCALRVVHREGWGDRAEAELRQLGIRPDRLVVQRPTVPAATTTSSTGARPASTGAAVVREVESHVGLNTETLAALVARFRGASINDRREAGNGGRLWVEDPLQRVQLGAELKALGFRWANTRQAWYYPEN